jgi:hypothetical protein
MQNIWIWSEDSPTAIQQVATIRLLIPVVMFIVISNNFYLTASSCLWSWCQFFCINYCTVRPLIITALSLSYIFILSLNWTDNWLRTLRHWLTNWLHWYTNSSQHSLLMSLYLCTELNQFLFSTAVHSISHLWHRTKLPFTEALQVLFACHISRIFSSCWVTTDFGKLLEHCRSVGYCMFWFK